MDDKGNATKKYTLWKLHSPKHFARAPGCLAGVQRETHLNQPPCFRCELLVSGEVTCTPWSKYMAQSPKGRLIQGLHKPIHGNCAIYFYPGVTQKWRFSKNVGLVQMIFLFNWVMFRFQPLIFRGVHTVKLAESLPRKNWLHGRRCTFLGKEGVCFRQGPMG